MNKALSIISWAAGLFFSSCGLVYITSNFINFFFFLIIGLVILPITGGQIYKAMSRKMGIILRTATVILAIILLGIFGTPPKEEVKVAEIKAEIKPIIPKKENLPIKKVGIGVGRQIFFNNYKDKTKWERQNDINGHEVYTGTLTGHSGMFYLIGPRDNLLQATYSALVSNNKEQRDFVAFNFLALGKVIRPKTMKWLSNEFLTAAREATKNEFIQSKVIDGVEFIASYVKEYANSEYEMIQLDVYPVNNKKIEIGQYFVQKEVQKEVQRDIATEKKLNPYREGIGVSRDKFINNFKKAGWSKGLEIENHENYVGKFNTSSFQLLGRDSDLYEVSTLTIMSGDKNKTALALMTMQITVGLVNKKAVPWLNSKVDIIVKDVKKEQKYSRTFSGNIFEIEYSPMLYGTLKNPNIIIKIRPVNSKSITSY